MSKPNRYRASAGRRIAELTTRENKDHATMNTTIPNQHGAVVITGQDFSEPKLTLGPVGVSLNPLAPEN